MTRAFTIRFDGEPVAAAPGQTVAAVLWAAGVRSWRATRDASGPRGLFCGIGACFDCLVTIDGAPNQRACLVPARPEQQVTTAPGDRPAAASGSIGKASRDRASTADRTGAPTEAASGTSYDVAVVGAGPAGLAAAVTAARAGCRVALLDSAPQLGGQFWRHRDDTGKGHKAWSTFAALRADLLDYEVEYIGAAVWFVEPGSPTPVPPDGSGAGLSDLHGTHLDIPEPIRRIEAHLAPTGTDRDQVGGEDLVGPGPGYTLHLAGHPPVRARQLVFATGTYDRALPFPGWELPGVVTPGAAQALLKGSGVAIGQRVVVAGAGPFLLPVATGLLAAGVEIAGVYEAGDPLRYARRPGAIAVGKLHEAAGYAAMLTRHRVPYRTRHAVAAARGGATVSSVDVVRLDRRGRAVSRSRRRVECDAVAVGYGFTPQLELPLALGCRTRLDVDGNLVLQVDVAGRTSVPDVYAAGEVTGVGGATLALVEGKLVGAVVALAAGRPAPFTDLELTRLLVRRAAQRRFAHLMHEVHAPPSGWLTWLGQETLMCRCEEVPVRRIQAAVAELGATDARTVKGLCRPGMGWCQGRVCGYATAALTAHLCDRPLTAADLETFARRPIAQPVPLATLAS